MDRLTSTIPHQVPPFKKGNYRELTLREATHLQSPAELIQVHCRCKGNCTMVRCKCFKAKAECTLHCHGRDGGAQCIDTGPSAAPSATSVESKRERTKKLNCLSTQEKENTRLIYREKTMLGEAEYHSRRPKPSTSAGARSPLSMRAGEAHGGYKPPGQI